MTPTGIVYLIGAGPWDPGLLTLRGRELLERADCVVYDYLANPELLRFAPQAEHLLVGEGAGRRTQAEINRVLVERGLAGQIVARLKGGDPFVFGRGGEEAAELAAAGVPFEVVPGVTAAIACAAYAGIPVTHRDFGSTVAFVAGHERPADGADVTGSGVDWAALARIATVVFYMGAKNLDHVSRSLIAAGRDAQTPVALIRWGTRPDQTTVVTTLADAAAAADRASLGAPLIALVGEIVTLRERLDWYERRALYGLRIALTRSLGQELDLALRLRELGADVISVPSIEFGPPLDSAPLSSALGRLSEYDWVVFTSANGVDFTFDALKAAGRDARAFGGARIAVVGPATARSLQARGLVPDLVPETFVGEGLADALVAGGAAGQRFLLLRAEVARDVLPERLLGHGARVDVVAAYRTSAAFVRPEVLEQIAGGAVDLVTFTSSSTVRHFVERFDAPVLAAIRARVQAVCIGPVAAQTAEDAGFKVAAVATSYTVPGLVDALLAWRSVARDGTGLVR